MVEKDVKLVKGISNMVRLDFTKQEVEDIKSKAYFTDEELKILEMWLKEYSIVQMAMEMSMGTATITRRKNKILKKIKKVI